MVENMWESLAMLLFAAAAIFAIYTFFHYFGEAHHEQVSKAALRRLGVCLGVMLLTGWFAWG